MDTTLNHFPMRDFPSISWHYVQRTGPIGFVIALHLGLFYLLQQGLSYAPVEIAKPQPKEVVVSLITLDTAPKPIQQATPHPVPKTIPIVKKVVAPRPVAPTPKIISTPRPLTPVVNTTPSAKAITAPSTPAVAPQPSTPSAATESSSAPAPAAKSTGPSQPKTISSSVDGYLRQPEQIYPPISRRLGEEGKVVIRVFVDETGHPEKATIHKSSGYNRLDEAARKAVLGALFKPHTEDGQAVPVYILAHMSYKLDQD